MSLKVINKLGRLNPSSTVLLLCDLQEKFSNITKNFDQVVELSGRVLDVARILDIPYVFTEQYPKGLGRTVPNLIGKAENPKIIEKTRFSMCTKELMDHIEKTNPNYNSVLLCGIEAHACVLSTCLDFLEANKDVHIICDAVSSRTSFDRVTAIERMKQSGAFLTSAESIIFQLTKDANHPKFKEIQKLIRAPSPNNVF